MKQETRLERFYPSAILILSAIFLFYKYIMQVYPSVITNQIMRTFHVHGAGLGNLAASFFYAYMITQLFVGVLLDKFSPRYLTSLAIFACALGTYIFSIATTLPVAFAARMLMGVGAAFATVSYMKLASNWFPVNRFAFVTGLLATAAMFGALFGEAPMAFLISKIGWRNSLVLWAIVGLMTAIIFYFVVRDEPTDGPLLQLNKYKFQFSDLRKILYSKQNWYLTFYSGLSFAPVAVFGGLWGNPFIREVYHLSNTTSATIVSLAFAGLGIGAPIVGIITDRVRNRKPIMAFGSVIALISVSLIIYVHPMPLWLVACLFGIFGLSVSTFMLGFTIGKEINPLPLAATVIALINTGDAIFGAFTEPLIGRFLDDNWKHKIISGVHYFGIHNYQKALVILPIYFLLALILVFFIKANRE